MENILTKSDHNYFPVFQEKSKAIGCICAKDFFIEKNKSLKEIMQSVCMVTKEHNAPDLLEKFKSSSSSFGIIIKINGELERIVTLYDIGQILIGKLL